MSNHPQKRIKWFLDKLQKGGLHDTDLLFNPTEAGYAAYTVLWFWQNPTRLCDWTAADYLQGCIQVCKLLRACHVLATPKVRISCLPRLVSACVCNRASQKVSILVLGPWCVAKTSRWKLARAASLDVAFLSSDRGGEHRTLSWLRYVTLADCAAAECMEGSHFTDGGAANILEAKLRSEIVKFLHE